MDGYAFILNDIRQPVMYFALPKTIGDNLMVNIPEIIREEIDVWINGGREDIYLDAMNKKFTFRDAMVDSQVIQKNRYGIPSRELTISFNVMLNGFATRRR